MENSMVISNYTLAYTRIGGGQIRNMVKVDFVLIQIFPMACRSQYGQGMQSNSMDHHKETMYEESNNISVRLHPQSKVKNDN